MAKKRGRSRAVDEIEVPLLTTEPRTEIELWRHHFAVLARAVKDRRQDAVARLRAEVEGLDRQISAVVNRREIAARSPRSPIVGELTKEIDMLNSRMKMVSRLLRQAEKPKGLPKEEGPTPEAVLKPASRDIVKLLEGSEPGKGITHQQAEAARKIAEINEAISAAGRVRATNLEGAGGGHGGAFRDIVIAGKLDEIRSRKYLPWCAALTASSRVTLDIVIKVAVYNVPVTALARHHRMDYRRVVDLLREGLDAYINQPWMPPPAATVPLLRTVGA